MLLTTPKSCFTHTSFFTHGVGAPSKLELFSSAAAHLEQEHVLGAIATIDGELARPLLGADDVQLGRKGSDGDEGLARNVGACGTRPTSNHQMMSKS
jgi:hypothetical protein